jgi:serine/threonine protein phosphatase PrpC
MRFEYAVEVAPANATGQDRAAVIAHPEYLVIALGDGAGGTGHGELAAQAVIDAVSTPTDWCALLDTLDRRIDRGQATAVVMTLDRHGITGASVGDSGALLIDDDIRDLTEHQQRKPLVGSGCVPIAFRATSVGSATLLVASDGLLRYASHRDIARLARQPDLAAAARSLVDLVRLPTGALQDDVAIVLARTT